MGLIFKKSTAQPAFTVAAAITGTARVGQTLTCAYTATKARANNVTVRWYSYFDNTGTDQVLIGTGTTYVLTGNELGRYIRAIVTASNPAGTVQSTSSYTAAVTNEVPPDPPTVTSAAAITGTLEVGQTLTVSATFSGADSVAYQWYSYTSAGGAGASALGTSITQALTVAEDGKYIGCQATGTNASGSTVSAATIVGPVAANASEAPVVVSAAAVTLDEGADGYNEGEYIICDAEFSGHTATPTFVWYKCDSGKANPEELVGAGATPIQPLPVSEPNNWRGALFLDQSLGLHIGHKYVYCVATGTNGAGSTPSESAAVGPIGTIQGAPLTQAMVGGGPYYLNTANTTYYLDENISFTGSGFVFLKSNQTLNLNGKTITYDNATPVFTYGDFESGATGWDWSTTGNPGGGVDTQGTGTYAEIYTTADFTTDYNARRINDGTKSLQFTNAACSQGGVESYIKTSTLTLTADVWYCFSMQCSYNGSNVAVPFIRVRDSEGNLIYSRTTANKPTTKSPYMYYIDGMFKAVATPANYVLEVGVTGTAGATGTVYIDDVRLCRARAAGIYFEPYTLNGDYGGTTLQPTIGTPPWDVTTLTSGVTGCKVKNGSLTQGQNGSQWCTSMVRDRLGSHAAHRLTCTVHGPNSTHGRKPGPQGSTITFAVKLFDCDFFSNGLVSGNRDNNWGSAILTPADDVTRCRFYNHTITAIVSRAGKTYKGNYFYGKARWTNARAIAGSGVNVTVHDNVVDNTGDYYGRGFGFGVSSGTLNVYNNIVRCVPSNLNQEYSGFDGLGFGDHVLQLEGVDIGAIVNAYGNTLEGYASYDPDSGGDPCIVNVIRINGIEVGATLNIQGNTIRAIATNGGYAFALASGYSIAYQGTYGTVLLQDNAIETNSSIVRVIRDAVTKVRGGSITLYDAATPDDVSRWVTCTYDEGLTGTISFDFIDCAIDAGALAKFASAIMAKEPRFGSGAVPADRGSVFVKWTITIATGAADTAVTITDKDGGTAYSGTAEASGNYVVAIPQYETTGSQTIDWNGVGSSQTGWTFSYGGNPAESFVADAAKTVNH